MLAVVAACGSTTSPIAPPVPTPDAGAAVAAQPSSTECPTGGALGIAATELQGSPVEHPWCVALRARAGLRWFLAGGPTYWELLVDVPARKLLWRLPWKREAEISDIGVTDPQVIDFDGDGTDELLYIRHTPDGSTQRNLVVVGFADPAQPTHTEIPLRGPFGMGSCTASYKLVDDGGKKMIEVVGNCTPPEKTTYVWNGKSLDRR